MSDAEKVSLINLNRGLALVLFDESLEKVLKNCLDPNTKAEATRSLILEFKITPDKQRDQTDVEITARSKTAAPVALKTRFFIGIKDGRYVAFEADPRQKSLFPEQETPDNVTPIDEGRTKNDG